jgi:amino acid adenylation domain-containing protein
MRLLHDYLTTQAENRGDAVAYVQGERSVTFGELSRSSNQVAHLLLDAGCGRGDRVCLLMDRSIDAVIALLGALKAGCSYVPIDPAAPASRTGQIVATVEPSAVVLGASAIGQLEKLRRLGAVGAQTLLLTLEDLDGELPAGVALGPSDVADHEAGKSPPTGAGDDAAYIMFTSGSTGTPKGAVISHDNVRTFIDWAVGYFKFCPSDRHSWQPPLHFDLSVLDVFGGLAGGAEVHIVPPGTLLPRQIIDFIDLHRLTQWFSVPSAMAYAGRSRSQPGQLSGLQRVLWCGEVMPIGVLRDWMTRAPNARFTNLYGPTETTVASSYFTISAMPAADDSPVPLGHACAGEEILVLDDALKLAAVNEIGEIYIVGTGVGSGYWNDAAQTESAFLADPRPQRPAEVMYRTGDLGRVDPDGLVSFVGRSDTQIKSRGYRIELGEIEVALALLPEVGESAVIPLELGGFEGTAIGCALSPRPGSDFALATVRQQLGERLPSYMIPTRWLVNDELPKNGNGKIDRRRLKIEMTASR